DRHSLSRAGPLLSGRHAELAKHLARSACAADPTPVPPRARSFGTEVPQNDAGEPVYFSHVTRYTTPAESSLTYSAPSGPTTRPTGRPIHTPFLVSPGRSHPLMKSSGGPCGSPLSLNFMRTTLYPVGTLRFQEP